MFSLADLATNTVKKITPYLSARRIGGRGHTFLNANEAIVRTGKPSYVSAITIEVSVPVYAKTSA